jgi:hypothetical protein
VALQIAAAGGCLPLDLGLLNKKKVRIFLTYGAEMYSCPNTVCYSHAPAGLYQEHVVSGMCKHHWRMRTHFSRASSWCPQVFMNLVNMGMAADLDHSNINKTAAAMHDPCVVSVLHPASEGGSHGLPAEPSEQHGCLAFLSVGSSTIIPGEL